MKLIGMLGGLGWETTSRYYRMLNERTRKHLGDQHTARVLLHSVDEAGFRQSREDRDRVVAELCSAGRSLRAGGADFLILANNPFHAFAVEIEQAAGIELLHISDPAALEIRGAGHGTVALLGSRATMEGDFYASRFQQIAGARVVIPDLNDRSEIDRIIHDELSRGVVRSGARDYFDSLIRTLSHRGAEAVVLACPELTAVVAPEDGGVRVLDTMRLHADAAVKHALEASYA